MGSLIISFITNMKYAVIYGWPFLLLIALWFCKIRWSKFPMEAIILEKRGKNIIKTNDRVGRILDKNGEITYYQLAKCKDKIPVYDYDWIMHNVFVPNTFLEKFISILRGNIGTIFLFKYGSQQYKPVNIKLEDAEQEFVEIKNDKGETVYTYQYLQFDPRQQLPVMNWEVIDWDNMNFMVQEQRASVIRRQKQSDFWKNIAIPVAGFAVTVMICLFAMKWSFDYAADVRGSTPQQNQGSKIGNAIGGVVNPGE